MGLKYSHVEALPSYFFGPGKLAAFCESLRDEDRTDPNKRRDLSALVERPISKEVEPYIGKLFLLLGRWDGESGVRFFMENIRKNNEQQKVLSSLFKALLLMYGQDCSSLYTDPNSQQFIQLASDCFVELFRAGFNCKSLLQEGTGVCWSVDAQGDIHANYCPEYTKIACWAKFVHLFIQATQDMQTIHEIWSQTAKHLSHCTHVPSCHFRTHCQYALFIQKYNYKEWGSVFAQMKNSANPACSHMIMPKSLVNCCVGTIRRHLKGPNVFYALDRMHPLPNGIKDQILLRHIFV